MRIEDIAWLAGLLEGEGSFGSTKGSPNIQLSMCDEDVVRRAAKLMNVKLRSPWKRKDGYQWVWSCVAYGSDATSWMMTLYPFLGQRRRARIREVLAEWSASPRKPRAPRGQRWMALCHPDRPRSGQGLCQTCYMRKWRKQRKAA